MAPVNHPARKPAQKPEKPAAVQPGDPGARLLVQAGNVLGPLTRFDRSQLTMSESRHEIVTVLARQTFRMAYEARRDAGNGPVREGVRKVADPAAFEREIEAQLEAVRASAPARLAAWAEAHGEDAAAAPQLGDCYPALPVLGVEEACTACEGAGKIACVTCAGSGAVPCATCAGRGATPCRTCKGAGAIDGVACAACEGKGSIPCAACAGRKTQPCAACEGTGAIACAACGGHGRRHRTAELVCTIRETFEAMPRTAEPAIIAAIKARATMGDLLKLASEHHSTAEANSHTLSRDTSVSVPVTSIRLSVGEQQGALIRGYGPEQEVLDYGNLAGMMLVEDLVQIDGAIAMTRLFPPKVNEAIFDALSAMLASEANFTIAMERGRRTPQDFERDIRGAMTAEYVKRAGAAVSTATSRTYLAEMARGPVWVLALPLAYGLLDLLLRGSGIGTRVIVLLAIMGGTFGLAALGHAMAVRRMQARIARSGVPKITALVDRLGLTRIWLTASAIVAALLSLLVAGLTTWIFPSH